MKKIITGCLVSILFGLFLFNYKSQPQLINEKKSLTNLSTQPSKKLLSARPVNLIEPQIVTSGSIVHSDIENSLIKEMGEATYTQSHLGKMNNKDPKVTISISDHHPEFQQILRTQLELERKNGYISYSKHEMNAEYNIKNHLFSTDHANLNSHFKLSKLPPELELSYLGYVLKDIHPENLSTNNIKAHVVKRIFSSDSTILSLQEESAENGSDHFIKEFVNTNIADYPAIISTLRSDDGRSLQQLSWNTNRYRYTLISNSVKAIDEQQKQMKAIAEYLTINNS